MYFASDFRFPMVADFLFRDLETGTFSLTLEEPNFLLLLWETSVSSTACRFFSAAIFSLFLRHSRPHVGSLAGEFWSLRRLVFVCFAVYLLTTGVRTTFRTWFCKGKISLLLPGFNKLKPLLGLSKGNLTTPVVEGALSGFVLTEDSLLVPCKVFLVVSSVASRDLIFWSANSRAFLLSTRAFSNCSTCDPKKLQ